MIALTQTKRWRTKSQVGGQGSARKTSATSAASLIRHLLPIGSLLTRALCPYIPTILAHAFARNHEASSCCGLTFIKYHQPAQSSCDHASLTFREPPSHVEVLPSQGLLTYILKRAYHTKDPSLQTAPRCRRVSSPRKSPSSPKSPEPSAGYLVRGMDLAEAHSSEVQGKHNTT